MKISRILIVTILIFAFSCKHDVCNCPPKADEVKSKPLNAVRAWVYIKNGRVAEGATVKIAYTLDSAKQEKYFMEKIADVNGVVVFEDLPIYPPNLIKHYYVNAYLYFAGDDLSSMNSGGNGPLKIEVFNGANSMDEIILKAP